MKLNITKFFNEACPKDYSASVAEIGNNAGADTWQAAMDDSAEYLLLDDAEKLEAMRAFIADFGAWDDAEIAAMSDMHLNALLLQFIAGDIREAGLYPVADWQSDSAKESRLFLSGESVFYYIGN